MNKVLIADDNAQITKVLKDYAGKEGWGSYIAYDGDEALRLFREFSREITIVFLDVMMPKKDGFAVCKAIRAMSQVPVIMITARSEDADKIMGLDIGADDYIVKPFDPKELVARVKAVLRRYEPQQEEDKNVLKFGELEINLSNYSVVYHGKSLDFPPKEFELLSFLAQHPNRVFTREQLLDRIWGYEYVGDTRTVDVHVKRIREKLDSEDEWGIRTVWSVGYKFGQK